MCRLNRSIDNTEVWYVFPIKGMVKNNIMSNVTLVLGGARSGKSGYGEKLATERGPTADILYVATAQPFDTEMKARIERHRLERPGHWKTLEEPLDLVQALSKHTPDLILLDCVTLWVSNLLLSCDASAPDQEIEGMILDRAAALFASIREKRTDSILISNEVGFGIVPDNRLGRLYRDLLGRVNQQIAAAADEVILMVAGIPLTIKGGEEA